jgi:hypothetical protein
MKYTIDGHKFLPANINPAFLGDGAPEILRCQTCGCVTDDPERHAKWHREHAELHAATRHYIDRDAVIAPDPEPVVDPGWRPEVGHIRN